MPCPRSNAVFTRTDCAGHVQIPDSQNYCIKMGSASHFEHVAHMNMFDVQRPALCIPVKLCTFDLMGDGMESINPDGERESRGTEEAAGAKKDRCAQILNYIKHDLGLGRRHDSSGSEDGESACSRKTQKTLESAKRKSLEKKRESSKIHEENEWKSAKHKVEEFLDFPAMISRSRDRPIRRHSPPDTQNSQEGRVAQSKPVPNTRHNALFLRDMGKDAQMLWLMSHHPDTERISPPDTEYKEDVKDSLDAVMENPSTRPESKSSVKVKTRV